MQPLAACYKRESMVQFSLAILFALRVFFHTARCHAGNPQHATRIPEMRVYFSGSAKRRPGDDRGTGYGRAGSENAFRPPAVRARRGNRQTTGRNYRARAGAPHRNCRTGDSGPASRSGIGIVSGPATSVRNSGIDTPPGSPDARRAYGAYAAGPRRIEDSSACAIGFRLHANSQMTHANNQMTPGDFRGFQRF